MKSRRNKMLQQRLIRQQKQTRTILIDYQKSKQKCLNQYKQLGDIWQQQDYYEAIQSQAQIKINLLDLHSLIGLKNQLLQTLIKLYELEQELKTKTIRRQIKKKPRIENQHEHHIKMKKIKSLHKGQIHDLNDLLEEDNEDIDFVFVAHEDKIDHDANNQKQCLSVFDIPVYRPKDDNTEDKLDRISRYVAALKRNMRRNTEQNLRHQKNREELVELNPEFIALQEQLRSYHQREEEIQHYINQNISLAIKQLQSAGTTLQENYQHKIMKIQNDDVKNFQEYFHFMREETQNYDSIEEEEDNYSQESIKQKNIEDVTQKNNQQLGKENQIISSIVNTLDETIENSEKKLNNLRERRKKLFEGDYLNAD